MQPERETSVTEQKVIGEGARVGRGGGGSSVRGGQGTSWPGRRAWVATSLSPRLSQRGLGLEGGRGGEGLLGRGERAWVATSLLPRLSQRGLEFFEIS